MNEDDVRQLIEQVLNERGLSSLNVPFHNHTPTSGGQIDAKRALLNSPQTTIAAVSGSPSSGGAAVLSNADSQIITDLKTAVNSLITASKNIGFIKS